MPVVVSPVIEQTVPVYAHWVGSVAGFNNAQIRPQVRGYLLHRNYEQGTQVEKGELLFEIDPREFQAGLDAAKGQLGEALATLKNSELHVARYGPLAKEGAVSQQEYEDALQSMARDRARVASARANGSMCSATIPTSVREVSVALARRSPAKSTNERRERICSLSLKSTRCVCGPPCFRL